MPRTFILLFLILIALPCHAETWINLNTPVSWTGTLGGVTFQWSKQCASDVSVRVFRRVGNDLTLIAERGPFDTVAGANEFTLSPEIDVQQGDLLSIAREGECGDPAFVQIPSGPYSWNGYLRFGGDFRKGSMADGERVNSDFPLRADRVRMREFLSRVIPVAASAPGAYGSYFRTAVSLHNPYPQALKGRFVFHGTGRPGTHDDPFLSFELQGGETRFYPDIVSAIGAEGIGSIDVVTEELNPYLRRSISGAPGPEWTPTPLPYTLPPSATARIFDDAGSEARAGFTSRAVNVTGSPGFELLSVGANASLVVPEDLTRFRYNVGVRTLSSDAHVTVVVRNSRGNIKRKVGREYLPMWFEQTDVETFSGGPVEAGDSLWIRIARGAAIVYGSQIDNVTNDAAIEVARSEWISP